MQMSNIAIVILNYLNYEDTVECVESILHMHYSICGIVVVDNGSPNRSYINLRERYKNNDAVTILRSNKNIGYAKGNNIGIEYARKQYKADFVLIANNDTVFIDEHYIDGLLNRYQKGIGVLGGKIILQDGEQGPLICYGGIKAILFRFLNVISAQCGSCFDFVIDKSIPIKVLHGCSLMFTPDFFKRYNGFYPKTFLYNEEEIIYYMCKCKKLRQQYVSDVRIFHKEDRSSLMSFQNDEQVINKYDLQSVKYAIWWAFKYYIFQHMVRSIDRL